MITTRKSYKLKITSILVGKCEAMEQEMVRLRIYNDQMAKVIDELVQDKDNQNFLMTGLKPYQSTKQVLSSLAEK